VLALLLVVGASLVRRAWTDRARTAEPGADDESGAEPTPV
jgi:hypothetical protein